MNHEELEDHLKIIKQEKSIARDLGLEDALKMTTELTSIQGEIVDLYKKIDTAMEALERSKHRKIVLATS